MAKRQTKEEKAIDKRVEAAYYASCNYVAINIMDIGKVFAEGRRLVATGADDETLKTGLRAFVDTIRKN